MLHTGDVMSATNCPFSMPDIPHAPSNTIGDIARTILEGGLVGDIPILLDALRDAGRGEDVRAVSCLVIGIMDKSGSTFGPYQSISRVEKGREHLDWECIRQIITRVCAADLFDIPTVCRMLATKLTPDAIRAANKSRSWGGYYQNDWAGMSENPQPMMSDPVIQAAMAEAQQHILAGTQPELPSAPVGAQGGMDITPMYNSAGILIGHFHTTTRIVYLDEDGANTQPAQSEEPYTGAD